jgi:hypothetical protein
MANRNHFRSQLPARSASTKGNRARERAVDEELEGITAVGVMMEPRTGGHVLEQLSNGERLR